MKSFLKNPVYLLVLIIAGGFAAQSEVAAQSQTNLDEIIPLIKCEDVAFPDLVRNLARQAGINFATQPRVLEAEKNAATFPPFNRSWTNFTAKAVLEQILAEHHLYLVNNTQTKVSIISDLNKPPRKFDESFVNGTNAIIPLIAMDEVQLYDALYNVAKGGDIPCHIASRLMESKTYVSVRWEGLTPRQALAALCDNYILKVTFDNANGFFRISQN